MGISLQKIHISADGGGGWKGYYYVRGVGTSPHNDNPKVQAVRQRFRSVVNGCPKGPGSGAARRDCVRKGMKGA